MQALLIFAFFGMIGALISSLVNTISQTAIQQKLLEVQQVETMFKDVEHAVNVNIIGSQATLLCCPRIRGINPTTGAPMTPNLEDESILEFTSWTSEQLLTDPWGRTIQVITQPVNKVADYIDNIDIGVMAPVRAFAFVSLGPDRTIDADLANDIANVGSYRDVMQLGTAGAADSDDIVHVFSTRSSMQEVWDTAKRAHQVIVNVATDNYRQQYEGFLPTIQAQYANQFASSSFFSGGAFITNSASLTEQLNLWREDAAMLANASYPRMPQHALSTDKLEAIGADGVEIPFFGPSPSMFTADEGACATNACRAAAREQMTITVQRGNVALPSVDDWDINYMGSGNLNGRVLAQ